MAGARCTRTTHSVGSALLEPAALRRLQSDVVPSAGSDGTAEIDVLGFLHTAEPRFGPPVQLAHYVIVGAASPPFVHAAEATLLLDGHPFEPDRVERHIDGLITTLLPGLDLTH